MQLFNLGFEQTARMDRPRVIPVHKTARFQTQLRQQQDFAQRPTRLEKGVRISTVFQSKTFSDVGREFPQPDPIKKLFGANPAILYGSQNVP
jgi:hypothetical protein